MSDKVSLKATRRWCIQVFKCWKTLFGKWKNFHNRRDASAGAFLVRRLSRYLLAPVDGEKPMKNF